MRYILSCLENIWHIKERPTWWAPSQVHLSQTPVSVRFLQNPSLIYVFRMEAAGVAADVNAYNALMTLYARAGLWEEAWAVLTTMRQAGIVPNTRSYNAYAPTLETSGIYAILMTQV